MKNKEGIMDKILVLLAIFILSFTVTMIIIFCVKDAIPDTLVACVFTACVGECSAMSWIKTTKDKINSKKGEQNNETFEQDV